MSSVTRQLSHICMVTDVHGACTHRRKLNSTVSHKSSLSLWGRFCQLSPVTCHLSLTDIHCRVTIVIYILLFFTFMCMRWVKSSQVRALLSLWRGFCHLSRDNCHCHALVVAGYTRFKNARRRQDRAVSAILESRSTHQLPLQGCSDSSWGAATGCSSVEWHPLCRSLARRRRTTCSAGHRGQACGLRR